MGKWQYKGTKLTENYVSKEDQKKLKIEECPYDIKKMLSCKKRMYFMLTNQLGIILPTKDCTTKTFMWGCVIGIKKYMTQDGVLDGLKYKEHKPGFVIKENSIKHWLDYLDKFPTWELYVPVPYIKKIKVQAKNPSVEKREYIAFDTKYLLSVFRSLNETEYAKILR